MGFEPTTPGLKVRSSTAELRAHPRPESYLFPGRLTTNGSVRGRPPPNWRRESSGDLVLKITDPSGGSASFYDTRVKLIKA